MNIHAPRIKGTAKPRLVECSNCGGDFPPRAFPFDTGFSHCADHGATITEELVNALELVIAAQGGSITDKVRAHKTAKDVLIRAKEGATA